MSEEMPNPRGNRSNPGSTNDGSVTRFIYDELGRVIASEDPYLAPPPDAPSGPAAIPRWNRTFEFRLAGSETQEQSAPLAVPPGTVVVAADMVRVFLPRGGDVPAGAIGAVEVQAVVGGHAVICGVQVGDFGPADRVVVQVDVTAHAVKS